MMLVLRFLTGKRAAVFSAVGEIDRKAFSTRYDSLAFPSFPLGTTQIHLWEEGALDSDPHSTPMSEFQVDAVHCFKHL